MKVVESPRWCFVDGMRGIAALGVVFNHLACHNRLSETIFSSLPLPLSLFCFYGEYSVHIFFVISGFVIAHSLRDNSASVPELGNFVLRRQFRLDPPYWAAMAFALSVMYARNLYPGYTPLPSPSPGEILANAFYLQRMTGSMEILGVAWTLCLEIQFYLFFILLLALGRYLCKGRRSTDLEASMILITGAISIVAARGLDRYAEVVCTWFPFDWLYFAGGVLCYLSVRNRRYDTAFVSFLTFLVVATSWGNLWKPNIVIGSLTMLTFWIVGKTGRLATWLRHEIFQYFGRISYSLYLIHLPITMNLLRFTSDRFGESRAMALVSFFAAGAVSIVAAHFFHRWVEVPSMRLATSFKRPHGESRAEPIVNPIAIELPLPRPTSRFPAMASSVGRIAGSPRYND